jgi:WD40 repeat protein
MHHAHQRGVIHRDLTPGNVLLKAPGGSSGVGRPDETTSYVPSLAGVPKITDFGLAKFLDGNDVRTCLTMPGEALGTPSYMAPEQAAGKVGEVGTLTDVYALGAVLYKLLTGHAPFEGGSNLEVLRNVQLGSVPPVRPSRWQRDVPADLELICLKCLEKEPTSRYASAEQLADELGRYLRGEPLAHTRPIGRAERLWRWCRNNPARALAGGLAVLAAVAVAAFSISTAVAVEKARAHRVAEDALRRTQQLRREAVALSARLILERGQRFCEQGHPRTGMLWMANGLKEIAGEDPALEGAIRANLAAWRGQLDHLRILLPHDDEVWSTAFSTDGKRALTGCKDGTARLWDLTTGGFRVLGRPGDGAVHGAAFSPDGQWLLTVAGLRERSRARLWEAATLRPGPVFQHGGGVQAAAFSPDGKKILTGGGDGTALVRDLRTQEKILSLPHTQPCWVNAVAFSPDGKKIVTASREERGEGAKKGNRGVAQVWDAATGEPLGRPLGHDHWIQSVAFSPDSGTVVTGSEDRSARLWEQAGTEEPVSRCLPHERPVRAVAFSPDGRTVLTGCWDGYVRLWSTATGELLDKLPADDTVFAVAFGPDGKTVLAGSTHKRAWLWTLSPKKRSLPVFPHPARVHSAAFSPDGKWVVTGGLHGKAQMWEAATGKPGPSMGHQGWVWAVAFSPDGRTVLTGSRDGTARLWEAATGKPVGPILAHPVREMVNTVAFSPDGKTVATGCTDLQARLWDATTGQVLRLLPHDGNVSSVAFSPDGGTLVTGSADGQARLWSVATGACLAVLPHQDKVWAVAFSPDGKVVLTGSGHPARKWGEARLWSVPGGKPLGPPLPHRGAVQAAAFSPDGRTILTGSGLLEDSKGHGEALFWDAATGVRIGPAWPHQDQVVAVAFSPDGRTALTGSHDHTARLGEVPTRLAGAAERVQLWVRVVTGLELDAGGAPNELGIAGWGGCGKRLEELGGLPVP